MGEDDKKEELAKLTDSNVDIKLGGVVLQRDEIRVENSGEAIGTHDTHMKSQNT